MLEGVFSLSLLDSGMGGAVPFSTSQRKIRFIRVNTNMHFACFFLSSQECVSSIFVGLTKITHMTD